MLKGKLIHPEIISALAYCGHGDKVLIADGNYPLESRCSEDTVLVYLGLTPGIPTTTDVLEAVQSVIEIESAEVMDPFTGSEPAIFNEFRSMLGGMELKKLDRWSFYETAGDSSVRLAIVTGEKRTFANILLTVGCA